MRRKHSAFEGKTKNARRNSRKVKRLKNVRDRKNFQKRRNFLNNTSGQWRKDRPVRCVRNITARISLTRYYIEYNTQK